MMDNLDADPSCALCPQPGANCTAPGATLSRLLLMPGYWRRSNTSIAVLACAAHRPCEPHAPLPFRPRRTPPGATRCPDAHRRDISGCGGGTAACREGRGLSGIYCTQCPEKQARHRAAAVLHRAAPCFPCQLCPMAIFEAAYPIPSLRHLAVRGPAPRRVRLLRRRRMEPFAARAAGHARPRSRRAAPRCLLASGCPCCRPRAEASPALDAPRSPALDGNLSERRVLEDRLVCNARHQASPSP